MSSALRNRTRRPGTVESRPDRRRDRAKARRAPLVPECAPEVTLESKLLTAWAALAAGYPIECPVCSGVYTADNGCSRCGSHLT